jgi:rSAM/selenodomain-associated transferase 2
MKISLIIPVYQDYEALQQLLQTNQHVRAMGHEIIVVDAGDPDDCHGEFYTLVDHYLYSSKGRARQMNAGAQQAQGDVLWFVHADSVLPQDSVQLIWLAMYNSDKVWGRFDVRLSGKSRVFRMIEFFMNWRSALSNIATGDQGIFVRAGVFRDLGGYPELDIMEDIELCKRLKKLSASLRIRTRIRTSSRRWEARGIFKTVWLMWRLRIAYYFGADTSRLAKWYE